MRHAWVIRVGMVTLVGIMVLSAGLILMADGAFAKGKPIAVPRVEDTNGELVGPVIGQLSNANPVVALTISVPSMVVQVLPNQFVGTYFLFFTTTDCSGQPYFDNLLVSQPHVFPIVGVVSNILYGPRGNSAPVSITPLSRLDIYSGACVVIGGSPLPFNGVIADSIIDLSTQFTPPFKFVYP